MLETFKKKSGVSHNFLYNQKQIFSGRTRVNSYGIKYDYFCGTITYIDILIYRLICGYIFVIGTLGREGKRQG